MPFTDETKVVLSVIGASRQSANASVHQCLTLPGVVVALATVIVVVVEEAANMVDVDVATVLSVPVATHEQTEDTTLLGWPKRATKDQRCTMTSVLEYLPGRLTGITSPSIWALRRYGILDGGFMCSSLFPAAVPMVPV